MNSLLLAWSNTYTMYIILGVFLVLMIVMTVIPQRKQKKKQEEMMNSIQIGDTIMTIGGFVGTIVEYDAGSDRYTLNVGTKENPTTVTIVKNAIRSKV
jgi:preprotein translocase subunit YajC